MRSVSRAACAAALGCILRREPPRSDCHSFIVRVGNQPLLLGVLQRNLRALPLLRSADDIGSVWPERELFAIFADPQLPGARVCDAIAGLQPIFDGVSATSNECALRPLVKTGRRTRRGRAFTTAATCLGVAIGIAAASHMATVAPVEDGRGDSNRDRAVLLLTKYVLT